MISYPSVAGVEEGGGCIEDNGSPYTGGGVVEDTMGLLTQWGRRRYHGPPFKGSGVVEDTMGLLSREVGS